MTEEQPDIKYREAMESHILQLSAKYACHEPDEHSSKSVEEIFSLKEPTGYFIYHRNG